MKLFIVLTPVLALMIGACSQPNPAPGPKVDRASEEKAIRDADARWLKAAQARDAAGEAAVLANDGVAYRENVQPLMGPAAYQAYEAKYFTDNPKLNVSWTTEAVDVAGSGDLAVQTGEYRFTGVGPKGEEDRGRFVTVWKKVNGEWKVAHDISSTTTPEVAAERTR